MKKLFSLLTVMAFALPMLAAGTASDAYLNISKYATIDQAGATVEGMETIYKYTEVPGGYWLTLSNYGVMKTDGTQNWFTNDVTDADNTATYINPWTATDVFQGPSAYFGENTAYTAKYKQPTKYQTFYVTFCTQVKQFAYNHSSSSYYLLKMNIYECTANGDGTVTADATPVQTIENTQIGAEVLASGELDPDKIYKVEIANSYSYLYEIAFKTPGLFDGEITAPEAYDVTDLVTHPTYEGSQDIISEAFTCHWSPCQGAKSYTVRVYPSGTQDGLVFRDKFTNCTANDVYEEAYENDEEHQVTLNGHADNNGWVGRNVQGADGGVVINNNGTLYLSGSEADFKIYRYVKNFTVKFKAKAYGNDTNCKLRLANGNNGLTVDVTDTEQYYTMVVEREFPDYYSILYPGFLFQNMSYEEGNNRVVLSDFKVYFGDYSDPQDAVSPRYIHPAWDGDTTFVYNIPADSTSFRFGKYINEEGNEQIDMSIGLLDYALYYYDVQAVYYGDQESAWSNQIPICIKPWPEDLFLEDSDDDDPIVRPSEFYLVGTFNDWNQAEDGGRLAFTATDTQGVYETVGTLEDNAEFKVITPAEDGWTWYGGQDDNGVGYFLINNDLFNAPLAMVDGANFRIENGGEYTFRVNSNNMTLTVVSAANPALPGDVNGDGQVTSVDVTVLYNYLLTGDTEFLINGDQSGDGEISSVDVTVVYNILLGVDY